MEDATKHSRSGKRLLPAAMGLLVLLFLAAGVTYARNKVVYVTVRAAKMRKGPKAGQSQAVCFVPYREPMEVLGETDKFYQVKWGTKTGWVYKSQVSAKRPRRREYHGRSHSSLTRHTGSKATAAGASRGLMEGRKYAAAKGLTKEYKMVEWMETLAPTPEALDKFMEEGHLGPYAEGE